MNIFTAVIQTNSFKLTANQSLVGVIFLRVNDKAFPEEGWSDFVVILAHWLLASSRMTDNFVNSVKFHFMDGPFELVAIRGKGDREKWDFFGFDRGCNSQENLAQGISAHDVAVILQNAANSVIEFCKMKNFNSPDIDEIRNMLTISIRLSSKDSSTETIS